MFRAFSAELNTVHYIIWLEHIIITIIKHFFTSPKVTKIWRKLKMKSKGDKWILIETYTWLCLFLLLTIYTVGWKEFRELGKVIKRFFFYVFYRLFFHKHSFLLVSTIYPPPFHTYFFTSCKFSVVRKPGFYEGNLMFWPDFYILLKNSKIVFDKMVFEGIRVIYSIISTTALLGNGVVIYMLIRRRKSFFTKPYGFFILNLTFVDCLTAITLLFR